MQTVRHPTKKQPLPAKAARSGRCSAPRTWFWASPARASARGRLRWWWPQSAPGRNRIQVPWSRKTRPNSHPAPPPATPPRPRAWQPSGVPNLPPIPQIPIIVRGGNSSSAEPKPTTNKTTCAAGEHALGRFEAIQRAAGRKTSAAPAAGPRACRKCSNPATASPRIPS